VYELTIPSSHSTARTVMIVQSILPPRLSPAARAGQH
jgi:hypothetical protein